MFARAALPPLLALAAGLPAQDRVRASDELPSRLLDLSRELTRLKDQARSRVIVFVEGRRAHEGLYLGDGLVVSARVDDIEVGAAANMRCESGRYRLVAVGNDGRLRLVTFYRLRDWPAENGPPPPRLAPADWRARHGDLVCLVGARTASTGLVGEEIAFWRGGRRRPEAKASGERSTPTRGVFGYGFTHCSQSPGASVLTLDGSLVGLFVQGSYQRPEETSEAKDRPPVDFSLVLDARWLIERARQESERPIEKGLPPSLGVTLSNEREMARRRAERHPDAEITLPPTGLRVTSVYVGSPVDRAGVQAQDFWVELNGKALESRDQVRAALDALQPGQTLRVRYRRGSDPALREVVLRPN